MTRQMIINNYKNSLDYRLSRILFITSVGCGLLFFVGLLSSIVLAIVIGRTYGELAYIPANLKLKDGLIITVPFLFGLLSAFMSTFLNFSWFMTLDSQIKKGFIEVALEQILELENMKFFSGINAKEQVISVVESAQANIDSSFIYSSTAMNGLNKMLRTENVEMVKRLLLIIPKIRNCYENKQIQQTLRDMDSGRLECGFVPELKKNIEDLLTLLSSSNVKPVH